MFVMFDMYVKLPPDASQTAVNKFYFTLLILPKTTRSIRHWYWHCGLNGQLLISSSATALRHSVTNAFGLHISLFSITYAWKFHYTNISFRRAIPEVLARVFCLTELIEPTVCLIWDNISLSLEFQTLSDADGCKPKYCPSAAGPRIKQQ